MTILDGLQPYVVTFLVLAGVAVALSVVGMVAFFGRNRAIRLGTGQPLLAYYGRLVTSH